MQSQWPTTGPPRCLLQHGRAVHGRHHSDMVGSIKYKARGAIWHCEDHGSLLLPRSVPHHAQRQVFQEVPTNFADETDKVQKAAKPPCKSDTTGPSGAPHASHLHPFQTNERVCGRLAQSIFAAAFMRPLLEATARLLHSFAKWHFPCPLQRRCLPTPRLAAIRDTK